MRRQNKSVRNWWNWRWFLINVICTCQTALNPPSLYQACISAHQCWSTYMHHSDFSITTPLLEELADASFSSNAFLNFYCNSHLFLMAYSIGIHAKCLVANTGTAGHTSQVSSSLRSGTGMLLPPRNQVCHTALRTTLIGCQRVHTNVNGSLPAAV